MVNIFTDGSALKTNQDKVYYCGYGVYIPSIDFKFYGNFIGTNNMAELMAIKFALLATLNNHSKLEKSINIVSDSEYCVNIFTKWINDWMNPAIYNQETGKKLTGKFQIKNFQIVKDINKLIKLCGICGFQISFQHVMSHNKDISLPQEILNGNNVADNLAVNGSKLAKKLSEI